MKPPCPFRLIRIAQFGLPLIFLNLAVASAQEEPPKNPGESPSEESTAPVEVEEQPRDTERSAPELEEPAEPAEEPPAREPESPPREPSEEGVEEAPPAREAPPRGRSRQPAPPPDSREEPSGPEQPTRPERPQRDRTPSEEAEPPAEDSPPEPADQPPMADGEPEVPQTDEPTSSPPRNRPVRPEQPRPSPRPTPPPSAPTPEAEREDAPAPIQPGPEMAEAPDSPGEDVPLDTEITPEPTEPEQQAETQVRETTRAVERELNERKTRIRGRDEAQALIQEILGAESRISQAEVLREERVRPRLEAVRGRPDRERAPVIQPEQRRAAVSYFQQRLRGEAVDSPPPDLFRRSERRPETRPDLRDGRRGDRPVLPGARPGSRVDERVEFQRPRYLNNGRRYVHFDSRASIPAILMAAQAMNQVRFQPAREVAPIFYERPEASRSVAPLPPENYRNEDALVVSYPVDEASMITSDDILFQQGSTQFADPYSYEIVTALADAMRELPDSERFVIEGHASAEGSYESNMILSQQRAERIVREMVRRGVSPYRLLPVGYGESEARHSANAVESQCQ